VVDYDCKGTDVSEEVKEKGRNMLKEFPTTSTEQTVNNGQHLIYWSKTKPKTIGIYHDTASLELLGEKKLCLMAPSHGYSKLNDNSPTEKENIEQVFLDTLKKHGLIKEQKQQLQQPNYSKKATPYRLRPCIIEAAKQQLTGSNGHRMRLYAAAEYKRFGYTKEKIIEIFRIQADFDFNTCNSQIESADAEKTAKCASILDLGYCLPDCDIFRKTKQLPAADRLIQYISEEITDYFTDQYSTPYVRVRKTCDPCANALTCANTLYSENYTLPTCANEQHSHSNTPKEFVKNSEKEQEGSRDGRINISESTAIAQNSAIAQDTERKVYFSIFPVRSQGLRDFLSLLMYQKEEKCVSNEVITSVLNYLSGKSLHDGNTCELFNRVAYEKNCFYIDCADTFNSAIKISADGWEKVDDPPILFKRFKHQKSLVFPVKHESLDDARIAVKKFFSHVNVSEENKLMLLCIIISYLVAKIAHPILAVYGQQGSAKSSLFKFIRRLVDPSSIELLTLPHKKDEIIQQMYHHHLVFYDNLSFFSAEFSDVCCRAVTGTGFSKREYYTNDDDIIYDFMRCLGYNGINQVSDKGDVLDRSVLIELFKIEKRKTDAEINAAFEADRSDILGGMLTVFSEAMRIYPSLNVDKYERLADFHRWGCAISVALGYSADDFTDCYVKKVESQAEETLNSDVVSLAFLKFFSVYSANKWEGTPTELMDTLEPEGIQSNVKASWPKDVTRFSRRLNRLIPALEQNGYSVVTKAGTPRKIIITKKTQAKLADFVASENQQ
jgi:hypothetical protein